MRNSRFGGPQNKVDRSPKSLFLIVIHLNYVKQKHGEKVNHCEKLPIRRSQKRLKVGPKEDPNFRKT